MTSTDAPAADLDPAADERQEMSLGWALSWRAARDPDRPALSMGEQTYTRIELDRAANRLARAFAALGVGHDDRAAVVLPNGPKHQISCFALWKLGATVIPLPARIADAELRQLIEASDAKLVIGVDPGRAPGRLTVPADFEPDPTLSDEPLPEVVATMWKASTSGGSTGIPKLIWEKKNSLIDPRVPSPLLRMEIDDVILHPATAHHNSPFCQTAWALVWGAHVILMERFDARTWLELVQRNRVRWVYLVPTMMSRILAVPEAERRAIDVSSIEVVMHMAAPCPTWVKQAWIDWIGPEKIWEIYAGTEGCGATMINGTEWLAHPGSVGKAPPRTEVRGEDGGLLPAGEIGVVWFYPPPHHPLGHPSDVAQTYGDMGWLDADGYLFLADRRTDMINTGGGNLYPAQIEAAIEQHPAVASVAVVGLPDDDLGAKAHAIVEVAAGHSAPEPAELAQFLSTRLSREEIPYTLEFTSAPLRDDAGKVRRPALREARLTGSRDAYLKLR